MTLDFIDNINEYGDNIVRLYGFDKAQAGLFTEAVKQTILVEGKEMDLSYFDFIFLRNCNLILRIAEEDAGITSTDKVYFYCDLTLESYAQMIVLLEPFCNRETKGFQYLYDIDSLTDFLFSPGGTW